jgi:ABC-type Zn uptake system ZnuABC Zn-binding protein ZnuA
LITLVRKQRIKALFFENLGNPAFIEQVARDSGGVLGRELYRRRTGRPRLMRR